MKKIYFRFIDEKMGRIVLIFRNEISLQKFKFEKNISPEDILHESTRRPYIPEGVPSTVGVQNAVQYF